MVSNGKTPTEVASDLENVVACNQLNIHRYKCSIYSGENAVYFFQRWTGVYVTYKARSHVGEGVYNTAYVCSSQRPQCSLKEK